MVSRIPSPPLQNSRILGFLTGHLIDIMSTAKKHNSQSLSMGLYMKRSEWYKTTGSKIFSIHLPGNNVVMCSDPTIYKEILGSKQHHFVSSESVKKVIGFFYPASIGALEGEQWQIIRKWMQRAINKQPFDPLIKVMGELVDKVAEHPKVNEIETLEMLSKVSFDAFFRVLYGWDPQAISDSEGSVALVSAAAEFSRALSERILLPIPLLWYLPTTGNRKIGAALRFLNDYAMDMISRRREVRRTGAAGDHPSFLDLMIDAAETDDARQAITDRVLTENIAGLFFAAYDTTSATLHMILNHLARAPRVQDKLREILRARFPRLGDLDSATMADLEGVTFLGHVIDEVNRLHSVSPFFIRSCVSDVEIGGLAFRRGMQVAIDHASVARDPDHWNGQSDLDAFRPERWAEFTPSRVSSGLTFGAGGRICLGRGLALAEMKAFVAAAVCRYRLTLRAPEDAMDLDFRLLLHLRAGTGNIVFERLH